MYRAVYVDHLLFHDGSTRWVDTHGVNYVFGDLASDLLEQRYLHRFRCWAHDGRGVYVRAHDRHFYRRHKPDVSGYPRALDEHDDRTAIQSCQPADLQ